MKTQQQHTAEYTLLSNSEMIPIDLINEILSRLPIKSIARFRCVSKSWAYILRHEYFTELFMTRSRARPQILISCVQNRELFLFSAPQVRNHDVITANYHMRLPCTQYSRDLGYLGGLVCFQHVPRNSNKTEFVICNANTGQSLTLPNVQNIGMVNSFLGFDPIDKQFKLLSMTGSNYRYHYHHVLTLGTRKLSWRTIESISHYCLGDDGICIDGVIYYEAIIRVKVILSFDVKSEKFRVIRRAEGMSLCSQLKLVNYHGKLGALSADSSAEVTRKNSFFELWVLVDAERHEWSKQLYALPLLENVVGAEEKLYFAGVTRIGEIVLSPHYLSAPFRFYVYYYNIESKTMSRVEIRGMGMSKRCKVRISLNHVEDVRFMQCV